ncbi:MAG: HEAT repeat domain-containing protein [Spirochaetaceae bacterium]|jgi:HEAT repeat protein|nr:HEAT repeat domain-containing protein [Spirochaetaceae bacterium]
MKSLLLSFAAALFFTAVFSAGAADSDETEESSMRGVINYGTDNEIAALVKKLRDDGIDYMDDDLIRLASKTKNQNIIMGIFSFFGERLRVGLEELALEIAAERENETPIKVTAALDYLGSVKEKKAIPVLTEIISSGDARYAGVSIRTLGKVIDSETPEAGAITEMLIDYYNNGGGSNGENREAVIAAVGSGGGEAAPSFLLEIINDDTQSAPLRMAALEAAGKLNGTEARNAVLGAITASASSADPNIRFAAVGALGGFESAETDAIILESFRDSYFRTRLAAIRAAKTRRLVEAVPYMRYRAENDEAAVVKEEAVRALGDMRDNEADTALLALLENTKTSDSLRSLCAEMLIKNDADAYAEKIIAKFDEAKTKKQTALYKGLLNALSFAKTRKVENLAARLFAGNDVAEKFYALDMTANNRFTAFKDEVEKLSKDKNISLSRRAQKTLESLDG